MKICYVTLYDATDLKQWSGTGTFIARSLQAQGATIDYCAPLENERSLAAKASQLYCQRITGKQHLRGREPWQLKNYARQIERHIAQSKPDVIVSPGTIPIALLDCKQPIVSWTDATFASLVDFYPGYSNLCGHTLADGNAMEQAALDRCALAIYSSAWAAHSATGRYGAKPDKTRVVPFGANIADAPQKQEVEKSIAERGGDVCRLLFAGVEWRRKGGDLVLATARELGQRGVSVELTLIGAEPPQESALPARCRVLGFLDKNTAEGAAKIREEFARAHFLLLPSRAECCAVVLAEASAFGVPGVASNVGGNAAAIREGVNGCMLPLEGFVECAAGFIAATFGDGDRYRELALSSRSEYEDRLNWDVAGASAMNLIRKLL